MMRKPGFIRCALLMSLLGARLCPAQSVYFSASSSALSQNTIGNVSPGGSQITVLTATGPGANQVTRCTALAVDALNGKLFLIDGNSNALWSMNIDGTGLTPVRSGLTAFATDLALDVLHQKIFFSTSSAQQNGNTVQTMDYSGANNTIVFAGSGAAGNGVSRCTAMALDVQQSRMFIVDSGAQTIWSLGLDGSGVTAVAKATNSFPTDVSLDLSNQQVYFTLSSTTQSSNRVMRVSYGGGGLTTLFTASGSVQRCTALDLDVPDGFIYLSDAGAGALWRVPVAGGSAAPVLSGLSATVKKLRWYSGPQALPQPGLVGINLSGQNVILSATNGLAGVTYFVLTSTNVALPLSLWRPISTNVLAGSGNFVISAANAAFSPIQFYVLQVK